MGVIKSKMGTLGSKMGRKFEQKRKAKWVKEKENLVKAYLTYGLDFKYILPPSFIFTLDTSPVYEGLMFGLLNYAVVFQST